MALHVFLGDDPSAIASIVTLDDKKVSLSVPMRGPLPDLSAKAVKPRRISDSEWETLARCSCYAKTFERWAGSRGQTLAESLQGARFDRPSGALFVLSRVDAVCVDIIEIRQKQPRRLSFLSLEEESELPKAA